MFLFLIIDFYKAENWSESASFVRNEILLMSVFSIQTTE